MEEWKTIKLSSAIKDIAAGPFGSNLPKSCFVEDGFPIIDGANLKEFAVTDNVTKFVTEEKARSLHRSIAKRGDVVVTISGTVGQISYIPQDSKYEEYLVSQRQFRCTFDEEKVDVPYLVYYFHSYEGVNKILAFANQVGVPALAQPLKNFRNIELSLPPLPLQRRISSLLSSLDAKIETNRRINARLEEMAQALFRSWFIDFTPFKQQEFVEDEYGRRPKGWRFVELGEVTKECKDKVKERTDVKVLSPITTGQLVLSDEYFTKQVYSKDLSKYIIVEPNAFAYNPARVNIGSIGINDHGFEGCVSPVYVVFKTLPNYERFMNLFIKTRAFKEEVLLRAIGGVRQTLNYTEFSLITTNWPPESVILKFNSIYDTIIKSIKQNEQESSRLSALRDTLLPKLMSGELIPEEITA